MFSGSLRWCLDRTLDLYGRSRKVVADTWAFLASGRTTYDLSAYGPTGFLRAFKGSFSGGAAANVEVGCRYDRDEWGLTLVVVNHGSARCRVSITDVYSGRSMVQLIAPGASSQDYRSLRSSFGWYDLLVQVASDSSFMRHLAGHVENGEDSVSDPAIGSAGGSS